MRRRRGKAIRYLEGAFWTVLGAALAFLGFAAALDQRWVTVLASVILASLVVARLAIELRRAGLERLYRELRPLRTRIPVQPIGRVDPGDVGIEVPALPILPGGDLPRYVAREVDAKLREAVEDGLRGVGPWIVVASGGPKVGKSRSLFEALRHAALDADLEFIAPVDADAVRALVETPQGHRRSVLWLDDLEPLLAQGLDFETLLEWHLAVPQGIVAATYGSSGGEPRSPDSEPLARLSAPLLEHAEDVHVTATTAAEVDPLRQVLPESAVGLVERLGLGAFLSAAPGLVDKLLLGDEGSGEECPEGVALVNAAIDWVRCGRTDPIDGDVLRELWPSYLRADRPVTNSGFESGLEWALKPVAADVALLKRRGFGYLVNGFVVSHVDSMPGAHPPPEGMWVRALDVRGASEALAVGARAYAFGSYRNALTAFRIASHAGDDAWLYAAATFNVGATLDRLGQPEEAIAVYTKLIQGFESDPGMRPLLAKALVNLGFALTAADRFGEALAAFDEVLDRYGGFSEQRMEAARALLGQGGVFARLEEREQAIEAYDRVLELFGAAPEPAIREQAGIALVAKGSSLNELGRLDEALEAYEEVISRYAESEETSTTQLVAEALFNYGLTLATQGRSEEAITVFDGIAARYADASEPSLREFAERATASKNLAVGGLKRSYEGDRPGDTEVIERANVAVAEGLRADFERNQREPIRIATLHLQGLEFFADSTWELHPSVNVLLGRNGYGKSLLLRIVAGMLQRHAEATGSLLSEHRPDGGVELNLVRGNAKARIARDRAVFLRGSLGKVPLLAIPDARFMDRSSTTLADPDALDLATDGAHHYLEQIPYQAAVEGMLSGLALDYWQHKSFDLPTFALIDDVLARLTDRALEFRRIERVGRTGSRIWVRTEGLDRDLEIQHASQGTLSVIAIFGLIHAFLQELASVRGATHEEVRNQAAIVVIDEIDAHLHPAWQQRIRNTLVEIFPNVQFLLTAHSPLVVAGCGPGEVSVLRRTVAGHEVQQLQKDFVGVSVRDLYTEIFEIEDLDETFLQYARLEATGEASDLEQQLDDLLAKELHEGLSAGEKVESESLLLNQARFERVEEVHEQRRGAEERELEWEAEVTRLKRQLGEAGPAEGEAGPAEGEAAP